MEISKKSMRIGFNAGIGSGGKTLVRKQTYSNVIPDATNANIKEAANAISSLCADAAMYTEVITTERL